MKTQCWLQLLMAGCLWTGAAWADDEPDRPRDKPAPEETERGRDKPAERRIDEERAVHLRELEERIGQIEREIGELREKGNADAIREREPLLRDLRAKLAAIRGTREGERREGGERRDDGRGPIPAELREKLSQMKQKIQELRQAGRIDEAAAVEKEARSILERIGGEGPQFPPEVAARADELKRQIGQLREAGETEKAMALERELKELVARYFAAGEDKRREGGERRDDGRGRIPAELGEKLAHMKQKIQELRQAGKTDEADAVEKEARSILQRFGGEGAGPQIPPEARERAEDLKRQIAKLREAGETEKAIAMERELKEMVARFAPAPNEGKERLQHLRAAVEHLKAAGLADLAGQAAERFERLQQELSAGDRAREGERREAEAREAQKREEDGRQGEEGDREKESEKRDQ